MFSRFDPARPRAVVVVALVFGVLAGLAASIFLTFTGEPSIQRAINIEKERAASTVASGTATLAPSPTAAAPVPGTPAAEPELVSRRVQRGPGLVGAYALTGAGLGLLFAVGFLVLRGIEGDPWRRAWIAGGVLAGSITVVPWLKYPPNPPAVGDPATLARRQALYVLSIAIGLVVLGSAARFGRQLRDLAWPSHLRITAVLAAVIVPLGVALALLPPAPDPVPVPATLIWRFRLASLGGNLLLWTLLTLGVGGAAAAAELARARAAAEAGTGVGGTNGQNSMPFIAGTPAS